MYEGSDNDKETMYVIMSNSGERDDAEKLRIVEHVGISNSHVRNISDSSPPDSAEQPEQQISSIQSSTEPPAQVAIDVAEEPQLKHEEVHY